MSRRRFWDLATIAVAAALIAAGLMLLRHGVFTMVPAHLPRVVDRAV